MSAQDAAPSPRIRLSWLESTTRGAAKGGAGMSNHQPKTKSGIEKAPTGIRGLDEITDGGLPRGRPTLVCGGPGCGKTMLGMEFLARGARDYDEPGVFAAFEETTPELKENFGSTGFDIAALCAHKKLLFEHIRVERSEIEESGEYNLEGLFIRLRAAIEAIGAKRIVLDTIESLFGGFQNTNILRAELRRLFGWLKEKGMTAVVTAETGAGTLTRNGLEEYVADCVIFLDHRVANQNSVRRLRVVKYRGSQHSSNEYPYLIEKSGLSVLPLSSLALKHKASLHRVSTGIAGLDEMLGGKGFFCGSSILVSGGAGTGKSSIAAHFLRAACQRGERALIFASEQSSDEFTRNMRSIGIDLEPWSRRGLLRFHGARAGFCGLEKHLVMFARETTEFEPRVIVVDPITNYGSLGNYDEVKSMVTRLVDLFKSRDITGMFISLTTPGHEMEDSVVGISSLMDTWILLRNLETDGERNRALYVLKSRGMAHSNQVREFLLTDKGAKLVNVYVGPQGLVTGSARLRQEAEDRALARREEEEAARQSAELELKRRQMEGEIAGLRAKFEAEAREVQRRVQATRKRAANVSAERTEAARLRQLGASGDQRKPKHRTNGSGEAAFSALKEAAAEKM